MVSKEILETFLNKKVFVKIIDDKTQVGILKKLGDDFYLEGNYSRTVINPEQIARITEEFRGEQR